MQCPDCGGAMWDNRETKRSPKRPDYKCKNRQCDKAVWLEKKGAAPAPNGNGHASASSPATSGQRALGPLYYECMAFARKACVHEFGDIVTPADVIAATATLFIQAVRGGAPIRATKLTPAPAPPPPPAPEPSYQDERDLPF